MLACTVTTVALAETAGDVVVWLVEGQQLRGTLTEVAPGRHVTIRLADGELRAIPWSSLRRIAPPGAPPPEADAPAAVSTPGAPPPDAVAPASVPLQADAEDPTVVVEIRASRVVQLQRSTTTRWETACFSPCNVALPIGALYRIVDGGRPIKPFRLRPTTTGRVLINVSSRSGAVDTFGALAVVTGGVLLYASLAAESSWDDAELFSLAGVAIVGAGLVMLLINQSSFSQRAGHAPERLRARPSRERSPAGERAHLTFLSGRGASVPVLTFRF